MPMEANRVAETATTTGTGTVTLAGAIAGQRSFGTAFGTGGNTAVSYTIQMDTPGAWEVGLGTYLGATNQLQRDIVLSSSAGGSKVSFGAGSKTVYVSRPAETPIVARARRATDVPVEVRAASGQTADLLQAYNAAGTKMVSINAAGILQAVPGGLFATNIRVGVDGGNLIGAVGGALFVYASAGNNIGFKTDGAAGSNVALIIPGGASTSAGAGLTVMTREKADARYAAISSLRYKDDLGFAARVPGFLDLQIKTWILGGELAEDDFRRGRPGYGYVAEDLAAVFPAGVDNDELDRPDRLKVDAILGALHAELQHLSARVAALEP